MNLEQQLPREDVPEPVRRRYELSLRHKLAMDSVGLTRTALNVQRPAFEKLVEAENILKSGALTNNADMEWFDHISHQKSFGLQLRFAKACLKFLDELESLADETLVLAEKEKLKNG